MNQPTKAQAARLTRAAAANELLRTIADHGRKFFRSGDLVSFFEVDDRGRVWFVDKYTLRRIYTHYRYRWRGFTEGGTLLALVRSLAGYISTGNPLSVGFGPYPDWYCAGDPWGYASDMQTVRDRAVALGILANPKFVDGTA